MDTDAGVREILKIIFHKKPTTPKRMIGHSSITSSWLNNDFSKKLGNVQGFRQLFVSRRWQKFLDSVSRDMLLSHRDYIIHVMYACLYENICHENIFDRFISVCALLKIISDDILEKYRVDFSNLNPDIVMVFYQNEMKSCFRKRKQFFRLVEYIRNHKYLKWTLDKSDPTSPDDSTVPDSFFENIRKELLSYRAFEKSSQHKASATQATRENLTHEVLSTTSVVLPDLPSEPELGERLFAYRMRKEVNQAETERKVETKTLETSNGDAIFNSDSKTTVGEHQENIARYENIIEAVIRHNHSKNSGNETVNNEINLKVNGILENFESKINSLLEVLDEYNEL